MAIPDPEKMNAVTTMRVERIARMMRNLTFVRGVTARRLAKEWGLCEQRLHELCAIAHRKVKAEIADPDAVTVKVCVSLERVIDGALTDLKTPGESTEGKNKSRASIVNAGKTWAMIAGVAAPTKVEVSGGSGEAFRLPEDPAERAKVLRAWAAREEAKAKK